MAKLVNRFESLSGRGVDRARYVMFLALLTACFLGGGGSRDDIVSLVYLRPFAAICLVLFLAAAPKGRLAKVRVPLMLLAGFGAWMLLQLILLPPAIWATLPGHALFAGFPADTPLPWRPISIAPDLTLNSIASLIVPCAFLVGAATLTPSQLNSLAFAVLLFIAVSCLLGIAQVTSGPNSAFHLYRVTNSSGAVGLFANRNHQAILLALAFPLISIWMTGVGSQLPRTYRLVLGAAAALVLLTMIYVTGSRSGLIFGLVSAVWSLAYYLQADRVERGRPTRWGVSAALAVVITAIAATAFAYLASSRGEAVQRLIGEGVGDEQRLSYLPTLLAIVYDFYLTGSGLGTFDRAYRIYEPFEQLNPAYLNHAHNDPLELVITGGLPAVALLAVLLAWIGWRVVRTALKREPGAGGIYNYLGLLWIALLFGASSVDYPLRTPILAGLLMIAFVWFVSVPSRGVVSGTALRTDTSDYNAAEASEVTAPRGS